MTSQVEGAFAKGLNGTADALDYTMRGVGKTVAPTLLGCVGGWLTGVGARLGGFQGLAAGTFYSCILVPAGQYINRHAGSGETEIHSNTKQWLFTAGAIAETAVPIFLTMYCGAPVLSAVGNRLPEALSWICLPATTNVTYTVIKGIMINISPALAQYSIETLRSAR